MGKCKSRLLGRSKNLSYMYDMTRHQAIDFVVNEIVASPSSQKAKKVISLFGLKSEELTEAGMTYENVSSLEHCLTLS
ncbi:MAG: hypothetical protein MJ180_05785 [Candidatus Gastranaerophilales bacterium]|nr:hypothetical protein [Candidatus Gastranaerophilales bacterium]